jgi:hypothetical protein
MPLPNSRLIEEVGDLSPSYQSMSSERSIIVMTGLNRYSKTLYNLL